MKKLLVVAICLGFLCFINNVNADELDNTVQDIVGIGIPTDVADELVNGSGSTLGERALDMVANGTITESQYKMMYDLFAGYPQEKRMALKDFYDAGGGPKIYDLLTEAGHQRLNDTVSLRDHAKDIRQQGASIEEIRNRLINEGVNATRVDALLKERVERRRDSHEDVRDRRENIEDRREDIRDRREDVRDRREDILDKREDVRDARHNPPPGTPAYRKDKLEDIRDRKEDIKDRREDIHDRREDIGDRREDIRDRRENIKDRRDDIRDKRENIPDRGLHRGEHQGVRDHGKGMGAGKGQGVGRGGGKRKR